MTDLAEQWVNIYKSKKHGSYWTGAFCYKTKEEAVKDLADKENYLTTVNIEDMLQKNKNVANNVVNENSQDLTEQLKKGELPEGWYYVIKTGDVEMLEYSCNCFLAVDVPLMDNEVTEVLAPVPSYEKWKAKLEENKRLKHDVGNLGYKIKNQRHEIDNRLKEIERLKELLKECKEIFDECFSPSAKHGELYKKIDEALK